MKQSDAKLFFSKATSKLSNVGQIFEREAIFVTENGDSYPVEISNLTPQMVDYERQLFSGAIIMKLNFVRFEVLEEVPSLFDNKEQETLFLKEINEETSAQERLGLEQNFTKEALEPIKAEVIDLDQFGAASIVNGNFKFEAFCLAYKDNLKESIIPLMVPHKDQIYPVIFPKKKAAEFALTALQAHPGFANRVANFTVHDTTEINFDGITSLIVTDALKFIRAITSIRKDE